MPNKILTITNKRGLHARAAAKFVKLAGTFAADITIAKDGTEVSGLSIMGIMMLAAGPGTKLTVHTDSPQADELFEELRQLFAGKFQDG